MAELIDETRKTECPGDIIVIDVIGGRAWPDGLELSSYLIEDIKSYNFCLEVVISKGRAHWWTRSHMTYNKIRYITQPRHH
jgi:hypothetical protein